MCFCQSSYAIANLRHSLRSFRKAIKNRLPDGEEELKKIFLTLCLLFLSGCSQGNGQPQNTTVYAQGQDFQVTKLFTSDNCSVYRFQDGAGTDYHYYTNCKGTMSSRIQQGKTSHPEEIQTSVNGENQ